MARFDTAQLSRALFNDKENLDLEMDLCDVLFAAACLVILSATFALILDCLDASKVAND